MANEVNVQPGHGRAGRHPTRQFLDSLSGNTDPGMFGRMFPSLEPLAVDDGPAVLPAKSKVAIVVMLWTDSEPGR